MSYDTMFDEWLESQKLPPVRGLRFPYCGPVVRRLRAERPAGAGWEWTNPNPWEVVPYTVAYHALGSDAYYALVLGEQPGFTDIHQYTRRSFESLTQEHERWLEHYAWLERRWKNALNVGAEEPTCRPFILRRWGSAASRRIAQLVCSIRRDNGNQSWYYLETPLQQSRERKM